MGGSATHIVYSTPLEKTQTPDSSAIYRNPKFLDKLIEWPQEKIQIVRDIFLNSAYLYGKQPCFGEEQRTVTNISYKEALQKATDLGSGIFHLKLYSDAEDNSLNHERTMKFVGIFSKNRVQWGICDMACGLYGIVSVPLYDTLGVENLSYCLNHSKIQACLCSGATAEMLAKLKDTGALKNIILFDEIKNQTIQMLLTKGIKCIKLQQVIEEGQKNHLDFRKIEIKSTDCYTFSYTSGTTGPPKGAMLSNRNLTSTVADAKYHDGFQLNSTDRYLSFLPLPHVMERALSICLIYVGIHITYYSGEILKIKDDCQVVKPTIFVAVPRLYNRMVDAMQAKFAEATGVKKWLLNMGLDSKKSSMEKDGGYQSSLYDSLVFHKTKQVLGGHVRILISGSAPIKPQVQQFMKTVIAAPFFEGYGQTENCAVAFLQEAKDAHLGHVGGIVPGLQFKLVDIPEMHYTHKDVNEKNQSTPKGQIWLRGPQVFMGYYKDKEKTLEAVTSDGWLKTGDVGMLMPETNALKIIDRKKNIFKLQQGEYVASEKVEGVYSQFPIVNQAFLHGQSTHNFAILILTCKQAELRHFAQSIGIKEEKYEDLCRNKKLKEAVCKELNTYGKKEGLYGFQQAKNLFIDHENFQNRGLLTNTFKLQRFQAKKFYAHQIQQMYAQGQMTFK